MSENENHIPLSANDSGTVRNDAEGFRTVPNDSDSAARSFPHDSESREIKDLEHEIRDLQITNKAKDMYIERMEKERDGFFKQVIAAERKAGELEAKLLQI